VKHVWWIHDALWMRVKNVWWIHNAWWMRVKHVWWIHDAWWMREKKHVWWIHDAWWMRVKNVWWIHNAWWMQEKKWVREAESLSSKGLSTHGRELRAIGRPFQLNRIRPKESRRVMVHMVMYNFLREEVLRGAKVVRTPPHASSKSKSAIESPIRPRTSDVKSALKSLMGPHTCNVKSVVFESPMRPHTPHMLNVL